MSAMLQVPDAQTALGSSDVGETEIGVVRWGSGGGQQRRCIVFGAAAPAQ